MSRHKEVHCFSSFSVFCTTYYFNKRAMALKTFGDRGMGPITGGISWVKGSVCFVLKFAFHPSLFSASLLRSANFKTKYAQNPDLSCT